MIAIVATMLACWSIMAIAPDTPVGKAIRRSFVAAPAARLLRITRGDIAVALLVLMGAMMIACVGEGDGLRMLMLSAPDVAMWVTTFEVSAYIDIIVTLAVATAALRGRLMTGRLRDWARRLRRGRRRATRSRMATQPHPANDDRRWDDRWNAASIAA